jgi:hypothetical protein
MKSLLVSNSHKSEQPTIQERVAHIPRLLSGVAVDLLLSETNISDNGREALRLLRDDLLSLAETIREIPEVLELSEVLARYRREMAL